MHKRPGGQRAVIRMMHSLDYIDETVLKRIDDTIVAGGVLSDEQLVIAKLCSRTAELKRECARRRAFNWLTLACLGIGLLASFWV